MGNDNKGVIYQQVRRHAVWTGIWFVVAMVSLAVRQDLQGSQQWLAQQALIFSALCMAFQFGRMFQGLSFLRMSITSTLLSAETIQATAAAPAVSNDERVAGEVVGGFAARDLRSFASMEDAKAHGWTFGTNIVAHFDGQPVPEVAIQGGVSYKYDGLAPERLLNAVPVNGRVFGKLLYRLIEPEPAVPPASPSGPVISF